MSASWWAQKLGQQAPAARPSATPPVYQRPTYPQPQQPAYRAPEAPRPANVTVENLMDGVAAWGGGEATKTETATCPNCGGDHYFSNRKGAGSQVYTQNGAAAVSPRCFDCGYSSAVPFQTGAQ